jgi:hypothetical protein
VARAGEGKEWEDTEWEGGERGGVGSGSRTLLSTGRGDTGGGSGVLCFRLPLQDLLELMGRDVSLRGYVSLLIGCLYLIRC